jgi:pimeloyl-ACP methyl ester carboxylesterase
LKSLARPEGFEPPTLRIRRTIKAPTHKDSCRKEVGNSSHKCRVRPAARASIPPSPSQSGSNLVAPCYHDSTKRRSFQATKRAVGRGWMSKALTVNRLRMRIGRFGPLAAPLLLMQLRLRLGVAAAELKPVDHISSLRCPVLVIGGTDDQHTTAADTHLLFAAAAPPKELGLIIA